MLCDDWSAAWNKKHVEIFERNLLEIYVLFLPSGALEDVTYTNVSGGRGDNTIYASQTVVGPGTFLTVGAGSSWGGGLAGSASLSLSGDYTTIKSFTSYGAAKASIYTINSGNVGVSLTVGNAHNYPSCTLSTFKLG